MLKLVLQFGVFAFRHAANDSDHVADYYFVVESLAHYHTLRHNITPRFVIAWPTAFYSPAFISNHQVSLPLHRQNI